MFLVGDWESVRRPVGVISLGTSQPFVVLYSWEDGELHGATVSSGTSETEIRSKGSSVLVLQKPQIILQCTLMYLTPSLEHQMLQNPSVLEVERRRDWECCWCRGLLQQQGVCPIKMARWPLTVSCHLAEESEKHKGIPLILDVRKVCLVLNLGIRLIPGKMRLPMPNPPLPAAAR